MAWLRGKLYSLISSFSYLLVFGALILIDDRQQMTLFFTLMASASLFFTLLLFRRYRLIEDTGTTVLNSAAQGYVELKGEASLYDGEIARSLHFELPPMVWYRWLFKSSWSGFLLHDSNGRCTIDPRYAEVITPLYKYNQYIYNAIYPGETVYALGNLETLKKQRNEWELKGLISRKLIDWKRQRFHFLDLFDTNRDGKIDSDELATAREAARKEVEDDLEASYRQPATHVISRPEDNRPYILSSIHPDKLIQRYKYAMYAHLAGWLILTLYAVIS